MSTPRRRARARRSRKRVPWGEVCVCVCVRACVRACYDAAVGLAERSAPAARGAWSRWPGDDSPSRAMM
eukprot:11180525-Lingulodinium_polyedra.AAC.1